MRQVFAYILLVLLVGLAGCTAAPWAQENPETVSDERVIEISNSSDEFEYIIGSQSSKGVASHIVRFDNSDGVGEVEVALTATDASESVSTVLEVGDSTEYKIVQPINYTVTVSGEVEKQYRFSKSSFDCNQKTHTVVISTETVGKERVSTTMLC